MPPTIIEKKDGSKRLTWLLPNAEFADVFARFMDEVNVFTILAELKDGFVRVTVNYGPTQEANVKFALHLFEPWFENVIALNKCLVPRKEPARAPRRPSKPRAS